VLTSFTYDLEGRLTQVATSKSGQAGPLLTWTHDETRPGYTYGIGRLTSTAHGAGGSRYSYDPRGRVTVSAQRVDPVPGGNAAAIDLTVRYGYAHGDRTSITYPSGRKLQISRTTGEVTALSLAEDEASAPVPVISALKWAPFEMDIEGWTWHTRNGLVPHERSFDLAGRMTRHPIGPWVRDVRYDAQDRIASFTHWSPDGTPQPALDQQFGYDENDRLTSVVSASASWAIAYDPNSNRASLSLNGSSSIYNTASTSNRLQDVSHPARSLAYDAAGNTTGESGGSGTGYNLAGQLTTLTKSGVTSTYSYDNDGQRIRKFSSTGPQSTVIFVYDVQGQLLGEYDHEGRAIREYIWLDNVPVAMFMPDPAHASGPPLVFHIHADHLNTPRAVFDTDGVPRWQWMAEPFGTTAPQMDPGGRGPFVFNLRFPGQYADAESGLFYNWTRYYDPRDGRYTQSDGIGLGGGINTYAYVDGNPLNYTDPTGECPWCVAAGVGALTDLAVQLYFNGFNLKCVNWWEVAGSGAAAGLGVGVAAKLAKLGKMGTYSTKTGGPNRPTYRFFKSKDVLRVESHPISNSAPDWLSYPHWHADLLGKPWSKTHAALIEPMVGVPATLYHAIKDECECQR
jgi:RHS repeat-associated protein